MKEKTTTGIVRRCLYHIFALAGLLVPVITDAQKLPEYVLDYKLISVQDGLASNFLHHICQDRDGFLWTTSAKGVQKFNGKQFESFKKPLSPNNTNEYYGIFQDDRDAIWIFDALQNNALVLQKNKHQFEPAENLPGYAHFFNKKGMVTPTIFFEYLIEAADGKSFRGNWGTTDIPEWLWHYDEIKIFQGNDVAICKSGRMYIFDPSGTIKQQMPAPPSRHHCLLVLPDGYFLRDSTHDKVIFRDTAGHQSSIFYTWSGNDSFDVSTADYIVQDRYGFFWILSDYKIVVFDRNKGVLATLPVHEIMSDQKLGSKLRPVTSVVWDRIKFDHNNVALIPCNEGLLMVNLAKENFQQILEGMSLRTLCQMNDQQLIVATYSGLVAYDLQTGQSKILKKDILATAMLYDPPFLYCGVHNIALVRYNLQTWEKTAFWPDSKQYPGMQVRDISTMATALVRGPDGHIWMGTKNGLWILDETTGNLVLRQLPGNHHNQLEYIGHIQKQDDGLLVAVNNSIYVYKNGQLSPVVDQKVHSNITYFETGDHHDFWIGTADAGLVHYFTTNDSLVVYHEKNGLSNNTVHAILPDGKTGYWVSTDNGINLINPQNNEIQSYLSTNGLRQNEFNRLSFLKMDNHHLLFGGVDGAVIVRPEVFAANQATQAPLRLWQIKINDMLTGATEIVTGQPIRLRPFRDNLEISVALLEYFYADQHQYYYYLEGVTKEWVNIGGPSLTLSYLPPGKYSLRLKSRVNRQAWSPDEITVYFEVLKPYYHTLWFWSLVSLLIALMIGGVYFLRIKLLTIQKRRLLQELGVNIRTVEQQKKVLEDKNQFQNHLLAVLSHELKGSINNLIAYSDVANELFLRGDYRRIQKMSGSYNQKLHSLQSLINNLLVWVKIQNNHHQAGPVVPFNLKQLVEDICYEFNGLMQSKNIHCLQKDCPEDISVAAGRQDISIILHNILGNAIKFTPDGGGIRLSCFLSGHQVVIHIADQGVGMDREALEKVSQSQSPEPSVGVRGEQGSGLGLYIIKKILEKVNGTIQFENEIQGGLKVTVTLPAQQDR